MIEPFVYLFALAFCRVFGFMQMMPGISQLKLPASLRFVIFLGITPFMVPGILQADSYPNITGMAFAMLAMKEMLLGMFIGLLVSLPLRLPQLIGDIIDNQRGMALTSQFNPSSGDESTLLGQLLMWMLVVYFYTESGFNYLIRILAGSFGIQPVTSYEFSFDSSVATIAWDITTNYLQLAAMLTLPAMAVMFMSDMVLGSISKFAPSMNVFTLSQPVKAAVAIAILISIHPRIVRACMEFFDHTAGYFL